MSEGMETKQRNMRKRREKKTEREGADWRSISELSNDIR